MEEMYNVISGSPKTALTNDINNSQTTISVDDISKLPSAPNYATIGKEIDKYEVIKYEEKDGDDLINVTRGVEGTAQSFDSGAEVARYITAKDINDAQSNIVENSDSIRTDEEIQDVVGQLLKEGSNVSLSYDDSNNELTISATDTNLSDEEVEDIVGNLITGSGDTTVDYDDANNELTITTNTFSGDYNDLSNIPSEFTPEEHDNDAHSEDYTTTSPSDIDSTNWDDYEIQKDGSDENGVINFKTE